MARPKFTHEQLLASHKRKIKALGAAREDIKAWKSRAKTAEHKLRQYVLVDDKPDYYLSMTGYSLFRRFFMSHGLNNNQMEVLMMISYMGTFFAYEKDIFGGAGFSATMVAGKLVRKRYVAKVKFPAKDSFRRIDGYVLAQKGKDLIEKYKIYYDQKMDEIRAGRVTPFTFSDGVYYRYTKLNKYFARKQRRALAAAENNKNLNNDGSTEN